MITVDDIKKANNTIELFNLVNEAAKYYEIPLYGKEFYSYKEEAEILDGFIARFSPVGYFEMLNILRAAELKEIELNNIKDH